ncbi:unnamed protein product [Mytilus coruscus]|uniref:Farnesoic acid O-methyl transferase domain-containing protein n=1 Tax=Mytilus coruscus TaxID=42192 RepID=A0A6J8ALK6_MYTCO|nr:unnamed protein product [Mytilus coruscus]
MQGQFQDEGTEIVTLERSVLLELIKVNNITQQCNLKFSLSNAMLLVNVTVTLVLWTNLGFTAAEIFVTTDGATNNILLADIGAFRNEDKYLIFSVKGCRDAMFILSSHTKVEPPYYHIIIGGYDNKKSILARQIQEYKLLKEYLSSEMGCSIYKTFWISWERGIIEVGRGNVIGYNVFLSAVNHCPFAIKNIEISTGKDGATVDWTFVPNSANQTITSLQNSPIMSRKLYRLAKDCPTFKQIRSMKTYSNVECGSECLAEKDCCGFRYYKTSGLCEIVSDISTANIVTSYHKKRM